MQVWAEVPHKRSNLNSHCLPHFNKLHILQLQLDYSTETISITNSASVVKLNIFL